ncbi:hypothetical protein JCM9279_007276 [Rhodotorula babjevae]
MTRPTLQRTLRLLPSGHWAPSSLPLNLALRHPRSAPPQPPPPPPPPRPAFDTLASDTTAAPSLQGVPDRDSPGPRTARPLEAAQPEPERRTGGEGAAQVDSASTGKGRRSRTVLGVELPDKPAPPEADECCMSGCATCVYDLYLDDVEHFHARALEQRGRVLDALRRARGTAATGTRMGEGEGESSGAGEGEGEGEGGATSEGGAPSGWDDAVDVLGPWSDAVRDLAAPASASASASSAAAAGAQGDAARDRAERELERAREALDPGMRAFLEMEARIKAKQREQAAAAPATAHPASPAPGSRSLSSSPLPPPPPT